jgi:Bacterial SH3 domain
VSGPLAARLAAVAVSLAAVAGCGQGAGAPSPSATSSPRASTTASPGASSSPAAAGTAITILAPLGVKLRDTGSPAGTVLGSLGQGTVVTVVAHSDQNGGWYQVRGETQTGWITDDPAYTSPSPTPTASAPSTSTPGRSARARRW